MWIWDRNDWPAWQYDLSDLSYTAADLQAAGGRLLGHLEALPRLMRAQIQADGVAVEACASMAIEGDRLDRDSAREAAAAAVWPRDGKRLVPDRRAEGIARVIWDARTGWDRPLTAARLCAWQQEILEASARPGIMLGRYRLGSVRVEAAAEGRICYQAPPAERIEAEMDRFIDWYNGSRGELPGPVRAGVAHAWIEVLHPFDDGNGRVGRAVADLALSQGLSGPLPGYLAEAVRSRRDDYYRLLEAVGRSDGDLSAWLTWWLETVGVAYRLAQAGLDRVLAVVAVGDRLRSRQAQALAVLALAGDEVTPRAYRWAAGCSERTARRDLAALVSAGVVEQVPGSAGRRRRYRLIC